MSVFFFFFDQMLGLLVVVSLDQRANIGVLDAGCLGRIPCRFGSVGGIDGWIVGVCGP